MKNRIKIIMIFLVAMAVLSACAQTDIVGKAAKTSFANILKVMPDQLKEDGTNDEWSLSAPDQSARFIWSKDFSKSPIYDVMIEIDAAPFIEAGLDVSKFPKSYLEEKDKIIVGTKLGNDELEDSEKMTAESSFNKIVELYRESVGYHEVLDHFGIDLGDGNKFEWAKDININDKDIVFVVDPEIFIEAGVNPEKVEGWVYASVETNDEKGKKIEVKKFLKAFDLQ